MDHTYNITGTVTEIGEIKDISQYLRKQEIKLRYNDIDNTGKSVEQIIKLQAINEYIKECNELSVDDIVDILFNITGRDYAKDGKVLNFTNLSILKIDIIKSNVKETKETLKESLIYKGGNAPLKESTLEELMIDTISDDPDDPFAPDAVANDVLANKYASKNNKKEVDNKDFNDLPF
jgi:hypothetical protein